MPTDLETRLRRGLLASAEDVAPAPRDLAALVRHRARRQRRTRAAVAAAGLAAALVFVGVPVVASSVATDSETAAPTERTTPYLPLYDLPTRGSLADDQAWLDAVAALPWHPPDVPPDPSLPDPPVADRRVHYAGDVPGGRVALVVGREGSIVHHLWLTGPRGAEPAEMSPATAPTSTADQGRLALLDAPSPEAGEATLVVLGRPGDSATWTEPPVVQADASVTTETVVLPLEDGVSVTRVPTPTLLWTSAVEVTRDGRPLTTVRPEASHRLAGDAFPEVQPADPRGLADRLDRSRLGFSTASLVGGFGLTAEEADPTLLAVGPLAPEWSEQAWLLGLTFPSGATGLVIEAERAPLGDGSITGYSYTLPFEPAGTALLDRVVVVRVLGGVVVSAPATAVTAEFHDPQGTVLGSLPLDQGAGTGPLPFAAETARLLTGDGSVVAEVPITSVAE